MQSATALTAELGDIYFKILFFATGGQLKFVFPTLRSSEWTRPSACVQSAMAAQNICWETPYTTVWKVTQLSPQIEGACGTDQDFVVNHKY